VTCDIGQKFRKRRCVDLNNNYRECDIGKCTRRGGSEIQPNECVENETCPVDFYWECWTNWSDCSVNCGRGGKQHRRRYCQDGHHGGKKCVKKHIEEERECSGKLGECPRNCIWKQWGSWSKCSRTCANYHGVTPPGRQTRYRKIYKPAKYGGKECHPDENMDTQTCTIKAPPCKSPCEWGEWSGWTGMKCPTCLKFEMERKTCLSGGFGRTNSRSVVKWALFVSAKMGKVIVLKLRPKMKNAIATSPCAHKTYALGPSGDHGATAKATIATLQGKCIKRGSAYFIKATLLVKRDR